MKRRIKDGLFWIGVVDWDRRLFDSLIPLPEGTSYNAYLVTGSEKTALIDAVDPAFSEVLMAKLADVPSIDYIVAHHGEQDHSGSIPRVLEKYPSAKVVCSPKCKDELIDLLHISPDRFMPVDDGALLDLGGKTLRFIHMPWVHWPETMVTYIAEDKTLMSCDFFGSHWATSDLFCEDNSHLYHAARRYFAEIMMPFRTTISRNLEKLKAYEIETICPSHGPIHKDSRFIVDAYSQWVNGEPKPIVVIPYVTMHGSTQVMVARLVDSLIARGMGVKQYNLPQSDVGELASALVDASTVVIGTPTVLAGPHPAAAYAAFLTNALRPNLKYVSVVGSYLWGGKMLDVLKGMLGNVKAEILDPVIVKGLPREADLAAIDELAAKIAAKHGM